MITGQTGFLAARVSDNHEVKVLTVNTGYREIKTPKERSKYVLMDSVYKTLTNPNTHTYTEFSLLVFASNLSEGLVAAVW